MTATSSAPSDGAAAPSASARSALSYGQPNACRDLLACVMGGGGDPAVLDAAEALLRTFGGVAGLARAWPEDLGAVAGVGAIRAAAVAAAFRLAPLAAVPTAPVRLWNARDVAGVADPLLAGLRREHVVVFVTDVTHQLRHTEVVSMGGVDFAQAPVREILNCVLRRDGWAFAIAHNHPGGPPIPSRADTEVTERMRAAARVVGVRFITHVVVGDGGWAEVPASTRLAELFATAAGLNLDSVAPPTDQA